jgi:hypothetical protein
VEKGPNKKGRQEMGLDDELLKKCWIWRRSNIRRGTVGGHSACTGLACDYSAAVFRRIDACVRYNKKQKKKNR